MIRDNKHIIFNGNGYDNAWLEEAERRGLSVSNKPDSYDICFVADGDTKGFLRDRLGSRPGEVLDTDGNVVGTHDGAYAYTVGQRKGLHLGRPAPDGKPRYVLQIDPVRNEVLVGGSDDLVVSTVTGTEPVWFVDAPQAGVEEEALLQVRAHGATVPVTYSLVDGKLQARVSGTLRGVAPGQSMVIYRGQQVLVQATVQHTVRKTQVAVGSETGGTV